MKIETSALELIDFYILQSNFTFQGVEKQQTDIKSLFSAYEIDIDFNIKTENEHNLLVFIKVEINKGEKIKQGYQIFSEGVAIFNIANIQDFSEQDKSNLMFYSTLSIAINNIRNYITNLSVYSPLGKYILPAIDVNDLHDKKKKQLENSDKRVP